MQKTTFDFFESVYEIVRLIPSGRATSYGAIAKALSAPKASRMVGYAMNAAHGDATIPAHRVVNRSGMLTGKMNFSTSTFMEEQLKKEGITVLEDKIQNWDKVFWDPSEEIQLAF